MRKTIAPFIVLVLAGFWTFTGCATLIQKRTQRIPVTSSPAGATVSVNGQPQGQTPLEIRLPRKVKDQVIRIESPGYNPFEIRPQRKMATVPILGNVLIGVALGIVPAFMWATEYDEAPSYGTTVPLIWGLSAAAVSAVLTVIDAGGGGRGYELRPAELAVTLTKVNGTRRVDTMFLEAADFMNIKWIRVRRD